MRFALSLLTLVFASSCAVSPEANRKLDEARAAYRLAAADPQVELRAQSELQSAANALSEAERLAQEGGASELIEHNAYLAERRARIAQRTAEARKAEADIAAAAEERRRNRLEGEAAMARQQARQAEMARYEAEAHAKALEQERRQKERQQTTAAAELAAEVKRLEVELADVRAKQTERGWVLTLKNELLFDSAAATLKPGAHRALDNLAQFLRKYPDRDIAIEGFTDSTGSKEVNQRLSERRAEAVKDALVMRGIESRRIDARGYGPAFPIASNESETGRQLNRRVEIVIDPS
jgi:outer membrane protein OmpA-like peptidoglycan-associated protein